MSARTLQGAAWVVVMSRAACEVVIAAGVLPERVDGIVRPVPVTPGGRPHLLRPDTALRLLAATYMIEYDRAQAR